MSSSSPSKIPWPIAKVTGKKVYNGQLYYRIESAKREHVKWEISTRCQCPQLIEEYENFRERMGDDEMDNEWEVEKILDKRFVDDKCQYLVKWKHWDGQPTWTDAEKCTTCINLIAAFENPKLRKMFNYRGHNKALWLSYDEMISYLLKIVYHSNQQVNLLHFRPDFPNFETPPRIQLGLNMGALIYENHWYLIIILVNHHVSRRILVADPLNTLIGVDIKTHPVNKRLEKIYPSFPITPVYMTQMNRSDICAYCVLASFERALFLYSSDAKSIAENIYYELSRAEQMRLELKSDSDKEISVPLKVPEASSCGPKCDFCDIPFRRQSQVDEHIKLEHMTKD